MAFPKLFVSYLFKLPGEKELRAGNMVLEEMGIPKDMLDIVNIEHLIQLADPATKECLASGITLLNFQLL